jgi:NitT/TauT family transport system ATP-binding protein
MSEVILSIDGLSKSYRSRKGSVKAIDEVTFDVQSGQFVSLVGPSGCGKTTLMMCMAGLNPLTSGEVRLRGELVESPPDGMAVVFQDYGRSLFPWLTVGSNVDMPLRGRLSKREIAERRDRSLEAVGLGGTASLYPWQLSGGMQQRVAIARGLAINPQVLLMDEPFASVDAQTRANLEDLVLKVWQEFGSTILFVTHDIDEAVYLSDRVVVLTQGPSRVAADIKVELPRPRDQLETKENPLFAHLRSKVYGLVMGAARRTSVIEGERNAG